MEINGIQVTEDMITLLSTFNKDMFSSLSANAKLSEDFIEKYYDNLNWFYICKRQKISESFMEKHINKLNWELISEFQTLSEDFIIKHIEKLDLHKISRYQQLSESFIETYRKNLNWADICRSQKLSESFIGKMITYVKKCFSIVIRYQDISESFLEKYWDDINDHNNIDTICERYKLSNDFLFKFRKDLIWAALLNNTKYTEFEKLQFSLFYNLKSISSFDLKDKIEFIKKNIHNKSKRILTLEEIDQMIILMELS